LQQIKPECVYFFLEHGKRTMRAVFEMKQASDMMPAFEPAMMGLDAEIELIPCMTADDLKAGFQAMG
jgi:hypothetical protein